MSRAFTPPDTMSKDDIRTVADVRRKVWINGMIGLGAGALTGTVTHIALQNLQRRYAGDSVGQITPQRTAALPSLAQRLLKALPPLGKNTFMLCLLGGGTLGSFVMSTTAGKNAAHLLHPVFELGRHEHSGMSPYQIAISKANEQNGIDEDELDEKHHRSRSLNRKASMKSRLETGHSLTGSHSNSWPEAESEEEARATRVQKWNRRQTKRRHVLQERITNGKALSNSTNGNWSEDGESN
mmetsp:Transcript_32213/g.73043  ORF Transcript_32213/g.73043 Transcript_32213/m.73043 type:complete len:240 (+) Transcript_32213:238-957(+)